VFSRVNNSDISGVMRELGCKTNCDKILEKDTEFRLFELPTVASA
jgi:hypothetical protein